MIARVHALATAAGCQLVASCDLAIAAESAAFAIPGGKGGLFCHTPLVAVARNVGRKRALEMALTGDPIDAATAADWGLINRAVPDDELDAAVADLIGRATRGSVLSKALGKRGFYEQVGLDQPHAYEVAVEQMASAAMIADAQEGFAAFLEKRHPKFVQRPEVDRRGALNAARAERPHAAADGLADVGHARSRRLRIVRGVTPWRAASRLADPTCDEVADQLQVARPARRSSRASRTTSASCSNAVAVLSRRRSPVEMLDGHRLARRRTPPQRLTERLERRIGDEATRRRGAVASSVS